MHGARHARWTSPSGEPHRCFQPTSRLSMYEALDNRPSTNEPIDASTAVQPRSLTDALAFVAPHRALASRVLFNAHADAFLRGLAGMQAWDGLASPSAAEAPALI